MTELHDLPLRDRWARLRFAIVGPLLAAPPEPGELRELITVLATKRWRHPVTGDDVQFGRSTIERWFYKARKAAHDPVDTLRNRQRPSGAGALLSPAAVQSIRAQYRQHPGWTCKLHYDNLKVILGEVGVPSYTTLRRYLRAQGMYRERKPLSLT